MTDEGNLPTGERLSGLAAIIEAEMVKAEWSIALDVQSQLWGRVTRPPRDRVFRNQIVLFPRVARLEKLWRTYKFRHPILWARWRVAEKIHQLGDRINP